jgi:hypothetical protein
MQQISYDILAYLAEHPDAQDTAEGIAGWWLPERPAGPNAAHVKEALAELVALELVLARTNENARTYYKVNRGKLGEIAAVLAQQAGNGAPES